MLKSLCVLPLLCAPLLKNADINKNSGFLLDINERGNYTIVGVNDSLKNNEEIKIYNNEEALIDEISDDAFTSCTNLKTIVLSYSITHISDDAFVDSIETVKYTGSLEEYIALGISKEFDYLYYYASDEGFLNYWDKFIRPTEKSNICNITKQIFSEAYTLYTDLSISERDIVDNTIDKGGAKISASMKVLIEYFNGNPQPSNRGTTWNQKGAISFIIVVAVIGMTSICVFYLMKTKQIID